MHITSLHLRSFRNIGEERIELSPAFNLFVGPNAQGKTNVVEAVGLLSIGRSFRTSEFRDMIQWKSPTGAVRAQTVGEAGGDDLHVTLDESRKTFLRNQKRTRPGGFSGMRIVLFAPEEIGLIRGSPAGRRRYLDTLIGQLVPGYRTTVRNYERVVAQRNRLLQDDAQPRNLREAAMPAWDTQIIQLGAAIISTRQRWIGEINRFLPHRYNAIAPNDAPATLHYCPHDGAGALVLDEQALRQALSQALTARCSDEWIRGVTLVGPHRDEIEPIIGDNTVKHFGSQGQHRTFVLALKIAEVELMREITGEMPILILDDVASELDAARRRYFFDYLCAIQGQVFITATSPDDVGLGSQAQVRCFDVVAGHIDIRK